MKNYRYYILDGCLYEIDSGGVKKKVALVVKNGADSLNRLVGYLNDYMAMKSKSDKHFNIVEYEDHD